MQMDRDVPDSATDAVGAIRTAAVDRHEREAEIFEQRYRQMKNDRFSSGFTYGRSKLDQLLEQHLRRLEPGSSVLDVGCGTGDQIANFRAMGFKVVGVEPAEGMRRIAQRQNPGVDIVDGSILDIPLPSDTFHFVSALEVIRYLARPDWVPACRELLRVLRPGGILFMTLLNRHALDGFYQFDWLRRTAAKLRGSNEIAHHEFVTPGEAREILTEAGADDIQLVGRMFAPLRLLYKAHPSVGAAVARRVERIDDVVSEKGWHVPFAGHLIAVARKPL